MAQIARIAAQIAASHHAGLEAGNGGKFRGVGFPVGANPAAVVATT